MSNLLTYPAHDDAPDLVHIHVRAALDGTNDPTLDTGCSRFVSSIKHTSTGLITVTLKDGFVAVKATHPSIDAPTVVNLFAQVKAATLTPGTKTVTVDLFKLVSAGSGVDATATLADPPAAASNATHLNLVIVARNTVVA